MSRRNRGRNHVPLPKGEVGSFEPGEGAPRSAGTVMLRQRVPSLIASYFAPITVHFMVDRQEAQQAGLPLLFPRDDGR